MNSGAPTRQDTMQTVSGAMFCPLEPRPADINIHDIACALGNLCRYGGHLRMFYSVAQHSVYVSQRAEDLMRRGRWDKGTPDLVMQAGWWGLMHDAAEAYLGDVIWPLKRTAEWAFYGELEERMERAILERFGVELDWRVRAAVKWADSEVLLGETRDLIGAAEWAWERVGAEGMVPYPRKRIEPMAPMRARVLFLDRWRWLTPWGADPEAGA